MTLTQTQTALLKAALDAQGPLFSWMAGDTEHISNAAYADIRADFQAWQTAYAANDLYIIMPNGVTQPLSGIDQVPIPPAR